MYLSVPLILVGEGVLFWGRHGCWNTRRWS